MLNSNLYPTERPEYDEPQGEPIKTKMHFKHYFRPQRQFGGPDYCDCCKRYVDYVYINGEKFWEGWQAYNYLKANPSKTFDDYTKEFPEFYSLDWDNDFIALCAECIASGKAHEEFGVDFTPHAEKEITERTPSFSGWQQPEWISHCDESCMYIGTFDDIEEMFDEDKDTGAELSPSLAGKSFTEAKELISKDIISVNPDMEYSLNNPWEYNIQVFKCLKCGKFCAYGELD